MKPTVDPTVAPHRPDPFMAEGFAHCLKCGDMLEPTGRGHGWRHVHDWFNPGRRVAGVQPPHHTGS